MASIVASDVPLHCSLERLHALIDSGTTWRETCMEGQRKILKLLERDQDESLRGKFFAGYNLAMEFV